MHTIAYKTIITIYYPKIITILLLILLCTSTIDADPQEVFSRSFMFTRPGYEHLNMQQALWHNLINDKHGSLLGGVHAITFYTKSIQEGKSARYFLPHCKNNLLVAGDDTDYAVQNARDIRAEWLNLDSTFQGTFTINPEQTQYGAVIEYSQNLKKLIDVSLLEYYWLSITIPILRVINDLNLCQTITQAGTTPGKPKDIIEAFRQPAWHFSKITGKNSHASVAEFRFDLGSNLVDNDYYQISYRSTLIIPAGNKPSAKELFNAVVGNNKHVGIGAAIFFQLPLNRDTSRVAVSFFVNLESIFLVRNKQDRIFDLKQFDNETLTYIKKPWSRFLLFNEKNGNQNIPGVNILTRRALVRPYGIFDFSMGWRVQHSIIEAELGYNVWGKSNEIVELRPEFGHPCDCFTEVGIAGNPLTAQAADTHVQNTSASLSTISDQRGLNQPNLIDRFDQTVDNAALFIPINHNNIDLQSAAGSSVLNHKVHISLGMVLKGKKIDSLLGVGSFLDLPQKNSTLFMWGSWVKLAATF